MEKRIALTFDGAPNPPGTINVLDTLDNHGIKGTFFIEGHRLARETHVALEIIRRGHEIGNHSYSHPLFDQIDFETAKQEILKTDDLIKEKLGVSTTLFRPPAGQLDHEMVAMILAMGFDIVPGFPEHITMIRPCKGSTPLKILAFRYSEVGTNLVMC